jgi:hypothetical protein
VLRRKEFKSGKDQAHSSTGGSGKILLLWAVLLMLGRILLSIFFG